MAFTLQIILIVACLFYGARKGGVALGLLGGIGIVILVFGFGLAPGKPPVDVMLTIVAVVAASATLQASGGLDVLLQGAERVLRRNPKYVSFLAPFTTASFAAFRVNSPPGMTSFARKRLSKSSQYRTNVFHD